jgi:hypothetical protein
MAEVERTGMMFNRRALLGSVLAAAALAGCQTVSPLPPGTPIGAVRVDVSRLAELGVGPRAALIKTQLEQELARQLRPTGRRGDATLVVAMRALTLVTYVGSAMDDSPGQDALESVVTLVAAGGAVIGTYPITSSSSPGDAGPWYDASTGMIDRRVALLVTNHALWITRYVGG